MIYILAVKEAFENYEIGDVAWIGTTENIADGLTKTKTCDALEQLLNNEY